MNATANRLASPAQNALTKSQLEFLNPRACRCVDPYCPNFWTELTILLARQSRQTAALPRAWDYRLALEPYLLRRVYMVADSWDMKETGEDYVRLLLRNVCLKHVLGSTVGQTPNVTVARMNIWVGIDWFSRVAPASNEKLTLGGMLYQCIGYTDEKWTRNIRLLPVLVMPESRKLSRWEPGAVRIDSSPDIAA